MLEKLIVWSFLSLSAWQDYHKKSISVWIYVIFGVIGFSVRYALAGQWLLIDLLASVGTGVVLLWFCALTKGSIGEGDGWFFIVSGLYLTWTDNWSLLIYGLTFSSLYGLCYLVKYRACCLHQARKKTIAFLPFLLIPGWWVICL